MVLGFHRKLDTKMKTEILVSGWVSWNVGACLLKKIRKIKRKGLNIRAFEKMAAIRSSERTDLVFEPKRENPRGAWVLYDFFRGPDGTRTRDLRRDRAAF